MAKFGTCEWWQKHAEVMNADAEYRKAAKGFSYTFIYVVGDEKTFARFDNGEIVDVHKARPDEEADYIIEASPEVWANMAKGKQSPKLAILTGKVKITKGNKMVLIKWIGPCVKLFTNMMKVPTEW